MYIDEAYTRYIDEAYTRYINDIRGYPLLSAEREKELSNIIHNESSNKKQKYIAKQELILGNLKLVIKVAIRVYSCVSQLNDMNLSLMDLVQVGNIALMRAADLFLAEKNYKFSSYAYVIIRQKMISAVKESRMIRLPPNYFRYMYDIDEMLKKNENLSDKEIASKLNIMDETLDNIRRNRFSKVAIDDLGELIERIDNGETPLIETLNKEELKNYLFEKIKELKPRHREVLFYYFFSNEQLTMTQVGKKMSICRERVRQVLIMALRRLREKIEREKNKNERSKYENRKSKE